ncbi:MAG TPA: hypothetical protein EYN73_07560 [Chromatiaceae bacterium]|jgi:glucan phosphoethanolaminetransferase (alkaline phosphatase superfamily)|nr:hypothetical protein [Chromatiaceae bacterium]HIB83577.1 hypothetical protein [Chromatiaceae bacterium]HIO02587.1 hypothetical protein [Alphaproteobacteria bacterium]
MQYFNPANHWKKTVFFLALLTTLVIEIALVERKYSVFSGGFGQSHIIDHGSEIMLFSLGLLLGQIFILLILFFIFIRIHKDKPLVGFYNFLCFSVGLVSITLVLQYQLLSYFSDAVSFQLLENLGGGSLVDSLLYVMEEGGIIAILLGSGLLLYWLGLKAVTRVTFQQDSSPPQGGFPIKQSATFLLLAALVPAVLLYANHVNDVRYALSKFLSYSLVNGAYSQLTDFDGDNYSFFSSPVDQYPFDASRYPYALDIPGNGADEDGFLGDFQYDPPTQPITPILGDNPKHLILIVLESIRGDLIGKQINGITVAPIITALGKSGTTISQAYSHVGYTSPSLKTLFSGQLNPTTESPSIFRYLKMNGYQISVFSGQAETFGNISAISGMQQSSNTFVDAEVLKEERAFSFAAKGSLLVDGKILLREFDTALGNRDQWQQPQFVYFNFQSAHFPYFHPGMAISKILDNKPIARNDISPTTKGHVSLTYWNAAAYADVLVGKVIDRLKQLGVYDNTLLMVTADHGESLFDDGFLGHGHKINRQQTHIPLVFNQPNVRLSEPVGLKDYHGLIMTLLGSEPAMRSGVIGDSDTAVFQYIGNINKPSSIGIVEADEQWTVMDLDTQDVFFSTLGKIISYQEVRKPALKTRVDRLIREWEKQRWIYHLAKTQAMSE